MGFGPAASNRPRIGGCIARRSMIAFASTFWRCLGEVRSLIICGALVLCKKDGRAMWWSDKRIYHVARFDFLVLMRATYLEGAQQSVTDGRGDWKSKNPGDHNAPHDRPLDRAQALGRADAHDGSGDGVRRRNRHAVAAGDKDHRGGRGLRSESMDGLHLGHAAAQRFEDAA